MTDIGTVETFVAAPPATTTATCYAGTTMDFIQRLRPGVQRGEITCSIRIWKRPRVKVGNRYNSTGSAAAQRPEHTGCRAERSNGIGWRKSLPGDGRIDLNCKGSAQMHDLLLRLAPTHFHVPKHVGSKGWIGLWLDVPKLDWTVVELALREAYAQVAPKKLLAQSVRTD
jgi:hypothetical protein